MLLILVFTYIMMLFSFSFSFSSSSSSSLSQYPHYVSHNLTSQTSKPILVPDGRLLRWTCRTTCQNDVRSAKIGNYITCGTVYLSWAFRFVIKHFTASLCLHRMVLYIVLQLLCCPVSLFSLRLLLFCHLSVGHRVWTFVRSSFLPLFSIFFFPVALWPNAGHGFIDLDVSRSHTATHHSR